PSLPRELGRAGFRTMFVYGGWPGFTSFHDYWRRIGYHEMLDRYDFDDRWFETSWGVADEILFDKVLQEMDRLAAGFDRVMLTTLTVSNHRPFDFPDGRIDYPSDERRREYVIAYADWALGEFFDEAERRPWFDETLFVVAVDHGPVHAGPALVPAQGYRVPLVFYSPGKLQPAVIEHQGSIMSLAVTLFELLGITPEESFYGRSLLRGDGPVPVELHHEVGMLGRDRMTVLVRGGGLLGWRYDGEKLTPDEPGLAQAVEAEALFRGAHERLYGTP
ncbi:MAG: LTA synthase family protein, partial [Gammaproteobacteria bacterium]|nr:LTA synthase family protein [Gammaproteobacteria bacterium]